MPHTVLVVEDDEILRSLMDEAISLLNVDVISCASADEALSILENEPMISLVVTDISMPGSMDGLELSKVIWSLRPALPVIVTSGNGSVSIEIFPANAVFLRKPWSIDTLHQAIKSFLRV